MSRERSYSWKLAMQMHGLHRVKGSNGDTATGEGSVIQKDGNAKSSTGKLIS